MRATIKAFEREPHAQPCCSKRGQTLASRARAREALQREIAERYGFAMYVGASQLAGSGKNCQRAEKPLERAHS